MSNGGIIGPVNDPTRSDLTTTFTSSGTYTSPGFGPLQADYLVVAGGAGGGKGNDFDGGGGGGARGQNSGAGGSGTVIIRAPGDAGISVSPGTNTVTTLPAPAGGCKVATFTVSGTLTTG